MDPLVEVIRQQYRAGTDKTTVIRTLLASGKSVAEINAAFNIIESASFAPPPTALATQAAPVAPPPPMPPPPLQAASFPPPPPFPPAPASPQPIALRPTSRGRGLGAAAVVIVAVLAAGGVAYAYVANLGPFSHPPYAENNFVTGLLSGAADIKTAAYKAELSMAVGPRDADAVPYTPPAGPDAATIDRYKRDATRAQDITGLLLNLRFASGRSGVYPPSLSAISTKVGSFHATDPTGKPYVYVRTDGGKNFTLTTTFETPEAIQAAEKGPILGATSTRVSGQTVTFTKDSGLILVSAEPPKPYFENLQDLVRQLPAALSATASVGGATDFTNPHPDWKFNIAGSGDFGDLSYAVDIDLLKKGTIYYFRINKLPSILLPPDLAKGQWVEVDPAASSTKSATSFLSLSSALPSAETSYKDMRTQLISFLAAEAQIADKDGLIVFKDPPVSDTVDGRHLYRYDLRFAKDAIQPFSKDARAELASGKYPALAPYAIPDAAAAPTASFDSDYAYYDANTTFTIWTDGTGHPAIVRYTIRIVPPDDAKQLAGKQVNVSLSLSLADINVPVSIEAPEGAVPFDSLMGSAREAGADAAVKSELSSVRTNAEIYYANGNTYASMCTNDSQIRDSLTRIRSTTGSAAACSAGRAYAVAASLTTPASAWCVDSTGVSRGATAQGVPYTSVLTGAHPALSSASATVCN